MRFKYLEEPERCLLFLAGWEEKIKGKQVGMVPTRKRQQICKRLREKVESTFEEKCQNLG